MLRAGASVQNLLQALLQTIALPRDLHKLRGECLVLSGHQHQVLRSATNFDGLLTESPLQLRDLQLRRVEAGVCCLRVSLCGGELSAEGLHLALHLLQHLPQGCVLLLVVAEDCVVLGYFLFHCIHLLLQSVPFAVDPLQCILLLPHAAILLVHSCQ